MEIFKTQLSYSQLYSSSQRYKSNKTNNDFSFPTWKMTSSRFQGIIGMPTGRHPKFNEALERVKSTLSMRGNDR
ncbi:hypothetical protein SCA6_003624 [Theobroma cacao]